MSTTAKTPEQLRDDANYHAVVVCVPRLEESSEDLWRRRKAAANSYLAGHAAGVASRDAEVLRWKNLFKQAMYLANGNDLSLNEFGDLSDSLEEILRS